MFRVVPLGALLMCLGASGVVAQVGTTSPQTGNGQGVITVNGVTYQSWSSYVSSPAFQQLGLRCNTKADLDRVDPSPSNCAYGSTTVNPIYDPGNVLEIPVVFHVLRTGSGGHDVSDALINSQVDILNEDFLALAGTNGAPGTYTAIQFVLAGTTRTNNTSWSNDSGSYWTSLSWDTDLYCNIYCNSAGGYLGYVPDIAQGVAGNSNDRIVVLYSAVGRNAPIGSPYNQGRTLTHEMGHYLGLYHTFDGGCGTTSCTNTGDTICDTNRESGPVYGCPGSSSSCSSSDPFHNYMDYSDDLCMNNFTPNQGNRLRCTLVNYRPALYTELTGGTGTGRCFCDAANAPCANIDSTAGCVNTTGVGALMTASGSESLAAQGGDPLVLHITQARPDKNYVILQGAGAPVQTVFKDGNLCVGNPTLRLPGFGCGPFPIGTLDSNGAISTDDGLYGFGIVSADTCKGGTIAADVSGVGTAQRDYQAWFRDGGGPCGTGSNLTNAVQILWVP